MALGFHNAGLDTKTLIEMDADCVCSLKYNLSKTSCSVIESDVSKLDYSPYRGSIDVVAGGFPCQAFSYAGQTLGFADTRGTLFFEFARCVDQVQPKLAVAENVRGLVTHDKGRTFETMISKLDDMGYETHWKILKAQRLGVPQRRERVFIIAARKGENLNVSFPVESDTEMTLREALDNCPLSPGQSYPESKAKFLKLVPPGGCWTDLPEELQKEYMAGSYESGGGRTGFARRLKWDEPCLTVMCSPAQKQTDRCHPDETRPLTFRECARIQTFPDAWEFCGSLASKYKQIGNAVPVNMAYHVGRAVIETLRGTKTSTVSADERLWAV